MELLKYAEQSARPALAQAPICPRPSWRIRTGLPLTTAPAARDASGLPVADFGLGGLKYNNLGGGAPDVGTAGGDSGGPQFIGGRSSFTSYGLGSVPVSIHTGFISASLVPEPSS